MKNIVKFVIPLILVIAIPLILFMQKKENNLQQIDKAGQEVFTKFHPTGISFAVIKNNKIIYEKSYGYKNSSNADFLNNNDIFNIASCTKAFTAAGIGKLVQEGLLSWDDKVIDYIPNFKLADEYITKNLTITDILSHHTGLGTFYGDLLWYNTTYTNDEVIERMQYLPIIKDFRSGFGYQNNMYMIAGKIIEMVSGQSWESYIKQNFFIPLEMTESRTSSDQFNGTENIAFPHYKDSTIGVYYFQATKPAASIWSNLSNLSHWTSMWLNNGTYKNKEILSPQIIRKLTSPQTILYVSEEQESFGMHFRDYALGWSTFDYNGHKIIAHDGGMPGFISKIALVPEENIAIIILNNGFDFYSNDALLYSIIDIETNHYTTDWIDYYLNKKEKSNNWEKEFFDKRLTTKDTNIKPTLTLESFIGTFTDKMYGNAEIKLNDKELTCTLLPAPRVFTSKLEHWNKNTFKIVFKDPTLPYGLIEFEVNESNKITGFKINLPSNDLHFENLDFKKIK